MTTQSHDPASTNRAALRDRIAQAIHSDLSSTAYRRDGGLLSIVPRLADAVLAVLPEPADRSALLREAADKLGRMDYDTDRNDYGYDTYRDAWNGGVMDGAALLRRLAEEQPTQDEAPRCTRCRHPKRDHDGRADHCEKHSPMVTGEPWCHACNAPCDYADEAQPISEAEAAATFARECTDHAALILWCADRVRSVDDSEAVQDAADYLHALSTRAQVDTTPITDRPAVIRWCAQQIHSMGGNADVERAAEYLDDLATEAEGEGSP